MLRKKNIPNIYCNSYLHTHSEVRTSLAIYSGASNPQTPPADPSDNVADSSADNGIRPTQCPFPWQLACIEVNKLARFGFCHASAKLFATKRRMAMISNEFECWQNNLLQSERQYYQAITLSYTSKDALARLHLDFDLSSILFWWKFQPASFCHSSQPSNQLLGI